MHSGRACNVRDWPVVVVLKSLCKCTLNANDTRNPLPEYMFQSHDRSSMCPQSWGYWRVGFAPKTFQPWLRLPLNIPNLKTRSITYQASHRVDRTSRTTSPFTLLNGLYPWRTTTRHHLLPPPTTLLTRLGSPTDFLDAASTRGERIGEDDKTALDKSHSILSRFLRGYFAGEQISPLCTSKDLAVAQLNRSLDTQTKAGWAQQQRRRTFRSSRSYHMVTTLL